MAGNPPPVEDISLLASMLNRLGAAGTIMDTPAAMTRNMLAGQNPISPLADLPSAVYNVFAGNPMDTEDTRATGRQVLTNLFGMSENDPDKWEWQDFAGFGAEMLLDPLNLVGAGWVNDAAKAARTPRLFHASRVPHIMDFDPAKLKDVGLHAGAIDAAMARMRDAGTEGAVYGVTWPMKKILDATDPGVWYDKVTRNSALEQAGASEISLAIQKALGDLRRRNEYRSLDLPGVLDNFLMLDESTGPLSANALELAAQAKRSPIYQEAKAALQSIPPELRSGEWVADTLRPFQIRHATDTLRNLGYDTIRYSNYTEAPAHGIASKSYAALDPSRVRIINETPLGSVPIDSPMPWSQKVIETAEGVMDAASIPKEGRDKVYEAMRARNFDLAAKLLRKEVDKTGIVREHIKYLKAKGSGEPLDSAAESLYASVRDRLDQFYSSLDVPPDTPGTVFDPLAEPLPSIPNSLLAALSMHGGARASVLNR